jgi:ankyrin repeat protein
MLLYACQLVSYAKHLRERNIMSESNDLFAVIAAGDDVLLSALLAQQPALVNTRSPAGVSPVLWAYYTGKTDLLPTLFAANPLLDIYDAAALGDQGKLLDLLRDDPALARRYAQDGFTALHLVAFFTDNTAAASVLLEAGAQVDAIAHNSQQVTPLHSAIAGGHATIARFLVERGANVNARQELGFTPLMEAAQNGDAPLVDYLLQHGADPALARDDGHTAADCALEAGHAEVASKL